MFCAKRRKVLKVIDFTYIKYYNTFINSKSSERARRKAIGASLLSQPVANAIRDICDCPAFFNLTKGECSNGNG